VILKYIAGKYTKWTTVIVCRELALENDGLPHCMKKLTFLK